MFKKTILLFFVLLSSLISSVIEIPNEIYYIKDIKNTFTYEDIKDNKNLELLENHHIGVSNSPFWTKLILRNNTNETKSLTLYNSLSGINKIDVFLLKDNKLINKYLLGDLRKQDLRSSITRYSSFNIILNPNETYTIISKVENFHIYNIGWKISNTDDFFNKEVKKIFLGGLIGGFIILFCLYNLANYYIYKNIEYLTIFSVAISLLFYQYSFHGVFYVLNININLQIITAIAWNAFSLAGIFILLFSYYFFKQKEKYKKLSYITRFFIFAFIILILIISYSQFFDEEYFKFSGLIAIIVLLSTSYLFLLAVYMYIKKEIGSLYYLIGQGSLLLGVFINTLGLFNIITYYELIKYLIPLSYLIDSFSMLIAVSIKNKIEQKNLKKAKIMLVEQSRFNSIGQTIGNISHQWKNPLTRIGTSITLLETVYNHNQKKIIEVFEKQLPMLKNSLNLMQKSIDEFSTFYKTKNSKELFSPYDSINNILQLLESKIILKKINIELNIEKNLKIYGFDHILSNIIMVLVDNSLDEFNENKSNNYIKIIIKKDKDIIIKYIDNAGGIKMKPVEDIFDYFKSTKNNDNNSGNGLAIVKMLVVDRLNGTISVKNIDKGVIFSIIIPDISIENNNDKIYK